MPDRPAAPAGEQAAAAGDRAAAAAGELTAPARERAVGGGEQAPRAAGQPGSGAGPRAARLLRGWAVAERLLGSRLVRWGFVALAVALGGYWVVGHWSGVAAALGRLGFLAVAGATLSVLIALFATMRQWLLLLAGLGSPLPQRAAARIFFIGQLGKYVPGSVWPVLAQMELGTAHKVPRHRSATASVLTMLLSLFAGLLVALVTLPFVPGSGSYRWVFLAAPVLLVCLQPRVLNRVLDRLLRLARRPPPDQPLSGRTIAGALAWSLVSWVFFGLQIWLLATRLGLPYGKGALLAVGGFAFAWCVGFVIVFVPVGAGVRDVLLIAMLGPLIGAGAATATALVSRVVMTAGDLITAAAAAGLARRRRREASP
jgi:glycosyltransferase 2 family protein